MPCTTILVGRKASADGSTMIARNDDSPSGVFHVKKLIVVEPKDQPRKYKSVLTHVEIDLPDNPMRYTMFPNVDPKEGVWPAAGINSENVAMTATETITTNSRVLGADPMVELQKAHGKNKEIPGGIGEENLVLLVLPYVHSAKEGVLRLGMLHEKFGTNESNGIGFSDSKDIWWFESVGGHHWMAKRVPEDHYVVMPNQLGIDSFDLEDAYGEKKDNLCDPDLKDFIARNHLDRNMDGKFNPRLAFGSSSDSDRIYNTPRAWFMLRTLNPRTYKWDGENADFTPDSSDLPWSLVPEQKITVEDVKYLLSSHFQGTPYDCYDKHADPRTKDMYRPIGVNRTAFMGLAQIRDYVPKDIAAIQWFAFGSNAFNTMVPFFPNTDKVPDYFSKTTMKVTTESFYWASRLLGALTDSHFGTCGRWIERYQDAVMAAVQEVVDSLDSIYLSKKNDKDSIAKANEKIASIAKDKTYWAIDKVTYAASMGMKNAFAMSDK
ncbi:MAG: C69 family dipeptidase [Bacilli bacterium]